MSLQISKQNGIFYLDGRINSTTLKSFKTYFKYNLSQSKKIIINIDNVLEIDRSGPIYQYSHSSEYLSLYAR